MKKLFMAAVIAGVAGLVSQAEAALFLHFDENGNGYYELNGGPQTPLTFTVAQDPGPGGLANALIYSLPTQVNTGDVPICESGAATCTSSNYSDLLRFEQADGTIQTNGQFTTTATQMVYYSEAGEPDLADVGIPAQLFLNGGPISEIGPEDGFNFFDWQPDGAPYPNGNEYYGISDVPEPASMALLGVGLAGLGLLRRRRR